MHGSASEGRYFCLNECSVHKPLEERFVRHAFCPSYSSYMKCLCNNITLFIYLRVHVSSVCRAILCTCCGLRRSYLLFLSGNCSGIQQHGEGKARNEVNYLHCCS